MQLRAESLSRCIGLVVAPDGRRFANGSPEFLALLGDPDPDYDAALFAVKNLGCIYLRSQDPLLEIVVHPRNVAVAAVEAAVPLIGSSDAKLFKIKYLSELEWRQATSTGARTGAWQTCSRLVELCRVGNGEPDRDDYHATRRRAGTLCE